MSFVLQNENQIVLTHKCPAKTDATPQLKLTSTMLQSDINVLQTCVLIVEKPINVAALQKEQPMQRRSLQA